jgi:NADH-quinone oxidoreductase subunit M
LGWFAVAGIIYGALVAWVQADMKKLVAYSSVSHLGFCMLGLAALTTEGVAGALFVCVAHGVSTGALFMMVGVIYERRHTRILADYGGIAKRVPVYAFFLVMTAMASAGLPALSGFPGEFLVLLGTFTAPDVIPGVQPRLWGILGATGVILAAVYILWMVQRVLFGPLDNAANEKLTDMNVREIFAVSSLMGAAVVLGLAPNLVLDKLEQPVGELVQTLHQRTGGRYAPDTGQLQAGATESDPVKIVVKEAGH